MSAQWAHTTATPMLSAPTPAEAFSANACQALREMVLFVQVCGVLAPVTGISSVPALRPNSSPRRARNTGAGAGGGGRLLHQGH